MKIKNGYDRKELNIVIGNSNDRTAELWIEFKAKPKKETLSYITLNELLDLKDEIQQAINEITK